MALFVASVIAFAAAAGGGEPMFVGWLLADDPGDQVISDYWQRAERDELEAEALVDLGTMVFYRGFPKDAIRVYRRALDADPDLYEAWFLIGLVEHSEGELDNARQAYQRCLKKRPGHGWANFYAGLLEEQLGHPGKAMRLYERAFKHAPELASPRVNPEVLASELVLGARLTTIDELTFRSNLPMRYLQPNKVGSLRQHYEQQRATAAPAAEPEEVSSDAPPEGSAATSEATPQAGAAPTPVPERAEPPPPRRLPTRAPQPTPATGAGSPRNELPYGMPPIDEVSPEARLGHPAAALDRIASAVLWFDARR